MFTTPPNLINNEKTTIIIDDVPQIVNLDCLVIERLERSYLDSAEQYQIEHTPFGNRQALQVGWKITIDNTIYYTDFIIQTTETIIFKQKPKLQIYDE